MIVLTSFLGTPKMSCMLLPQEANLLSAQVNFCCQLFCKLEVNAAEELRKEFPWQGLRSYPTTQKSCPHSLESTTRHYDHPDSP